MEPITKVRFYREKEGVLAVFPEHKEYRGKTVFNWCYARVGQHALSQREYHYHLPKASRNEYRNLQTELTAIGYRLKVLNKN